MIRFRTIDPTQPEKPAPQPAPVQAVAAVQTEPVPEGAAPATRKGLARKTPLRAKKKTEAAPLFDK
ncbi:conserved hypothetical protein [Bosea sp. 62]|uniref:hypothetical protein n=1 Tax=unclassified Bosea (in: a-proteobacteria) TaxID=2653178 RepID=UPI001254294A|nr:MULTISPECIES: hypothetical protein [unclassified Bosea (in: a-proteobacteria)]CAD5292209.1 conserved hypothetical protein [Bosea sp. 7B]CAD5299272.1 conserved hypothetical protein [Bosea sp. 21B]CAD5299397.1 conserved hypothetical protein [Bosea sp. 46]VVT61646.1 conserved hypothetical protein [Bosea sp. EC-HK365B]VXB06940.1 conserved hypothetical protein [Bosea sp. 127]